MNIEKNEELPVIILAGGRGTRLGSGFEQIPKPLVRIGEFPILLHIMSIYIKYGSRRFIICTGFESIAFTKYFESICCFKSGDEFELDMLIFDKISNRSFSNKSEIISVKILDTGLETTTLGRLKKARHYITSEVFLATYGDGVADIDIGKVLKFHKSNRFEVTLSAFHPPSRFGELTLDKSGQVKTFEEKQLSAALVNAGFFVMNRNGFIDDADVGETLEEGLLSELCARGLLGAVSFETRWQMMDTPREVEILSNYVLEQNAFWLL